MSDYETVRATLKIMDVLNFNGVPGAVVTDAALEALSRIQAGERELEAEVRAAKAQASADIATLNKVIRAERDRAREMLVSNKLWAETQAENRDLRERVAWCEAAHPSEQALSLTEDVKEPDPEGERP